jgi:hypothetical protein
MARGYVKVDQKVHVRGGVSEVMVQLEEVDISAAAPWSGEERRSCEDRRTVGDRRGGGRTTWQRRSGHDRRGHKFYARSRSAAAE